MILKTNKILFCTDLSENSKHALNYAISLCEQLDAKIHLIYVIEKISDEIMIAMQSYTVDPKTRHDVRSKHMELSSEAFKQAQQSFWAEMPPERQHLEKRVESATVIVGYPSEKILEYSKKNSFDLIIMGTHKRGIRHSFLGSVAKGVIRRSAIPTLIVPISEEEF
jgi:nucleotide-binding universal stress UspA family protein